MFSGHADTTILVHLLCVHLYTHVAEINGTLFQPNCHIQKKKDNSSENRNDSIYMTWLLTCDSQPP